MREGKGGEEWKGWRGKGRCKLCPLLQEFMWAPMFSYLFVRGSSEERRWFGKRSLQIGSRSRKLSVGFSCVDDDWQIYHRL